MNSPELSPQTRSQGIGCLRMGGGVGIFLMLIIGGVLLLWAIGGMLIVSDAVIESDAIVLLSGGDIQRWQEAGKLYKDKVAAVVLLTETDQLVGSSNIPYSRLVENNISAMGIPKDQIHITHTISTSTYDEAQSVLEFMREMGYKSCIIVTDPYHTFRTRMVFKSVFRGSNIAIRVHSVQGHWYRSSSWFLSKRGWTATLSELGKIGAFLLGLKGS